MDSVLETDVVVVSADMMTNPTPRAGAASEIVERGAAIPCTYRFSRNVFALTIFLPMALAFHAQNDPDGSTWYNDGPR